MRGSSPMGANLRSFLPGLPRQSIDLRKTFLAKKMDARVKPAHDELAKQLKLAPMTPPPLRIPLRPTARSPIRGIAHQAELYDLYAREETTAPARLRIEGAVTHGNGNSSGSIPRSGSEIRKESAEATPRAEQRLLSARGRLDCRGKGDRQEGAHLHGEQGPADHQQVLVRRCVSVRAAALGQGARA